MVNDYVALSTTFLHRDSLLSLAAHCGYFIHGNMDMASHKVVPMHVYNSYFDSFTVDFEDTSPMH